MYSGIQRHISVTNFNVDNFDIYDRQNCADSIPTSHSLRQCEMNDNPISDVIRQRDIIINRAANYLALQRGM